MATSKEHTYYRAVRRAAAAVSSSKTLKQALDAIVRNTARAMEAGTSLMLLDATGTKLIHGSTWGLPQSYVHKGVLDPTKSLAEMVTGKPVAIQDAARDERVQYPEIAARAGIASILGVPVAVDSRLVASIRVYTREPATFDSGDISFVTTMAHLAAAAIHSREAREENQKTEPVKAPTRAGVLQQARSVAFAHPSEEEFAHILDFYRIEWAYEPRSFPLRWDGDRVTEMFTPDFYLPGLDLYVELTTLRQSLVTEKNRKLRRLRELYPDIKITLLYKKDFDRLLAKYGAGPLAQARGRGISRVLYSNAQIDHRVRELAEQISTDYAGRRPLLVGVLRGVFCFMSDLVRHMTIPLDVDFMAISYYSGGDTSAVKITKDMDLSLTGRDVIMVEDIVDTGMTLNYMLNYLRARQPASLEVCTLLDKRVRRLMDVSLKYIGFEVPDEFMVGYGLDYREEYRNLPFIGVIAPEEKAPRSSTEVSEKGQGK